MGTRFFSDKNRPVHLGPYPLERLVRGSMPDLTKVPPEHTEMIRFYLDFWRQHRDVLMDGNLAPLGPGELYPAAVASTPEKLLAAKFRAVHFLVSTLLINRSPHLPTTTVRPP